MSENFLFMQFDIQQHFGGNGYNTFCKTLRSWQLLYVTR